MFRYLPPGWLSGSAGGIFPSVVTCQRGGNDGLFIPNFQVRRDGEHAANKEPPYVP